jgi:hypothetical protein
MKDRRGYETTAILQPRRRGGKGPRILYFFRTPPAIRVGRGAIDEDAIRLIEQHNPDVQFDWPRILKQAPEIKASDEEAPQSRGRGGDRRQGDRPKGADRRSQDRPQKPAERAQPVVEAPPESVIEEPREPAVEDVAPLELDEENREAAVFQRLGPEALARLRARYAEVQARIAERQMDESEREQLKMRAERLNPDGWVTDADVDDGLEQYEAVYETIRAVVGRARKHR